MPLFLSISRHMPENCPVFNAKTRKVYMNWYSKLEGILKKHGVRLIWGGSVYTEHLSVYVFEAPSLEAFQKATFEPDFDAIHEYETVETKLVASMEDAMKTLSEL